MLGQSFLKEITKHFIIGMMMKFKLSIILAAGFKEKPRNRGGFIIRDRVLTWDHEFRAFGHDGRECVAGGCWHVTGETIDGR